MRLLVPLLENTHSLTDLQDQIKAHLRLTNQQDLFPDQPIEVTEAEGAVEEALKAINFNKSPILNSNLTNFISLKLFYKFTLFVITKKDPFFFIVSI